MRCSFASCHAASVAAVMGVRSSFDDNAVVIAGKQGQPKGSKVFGTIPHERRNKRHVKILAMAYIIAYCPRKSIIFFSSHIQEASDLMSKKMAHDMH
uniref:Uncharacterized protein n=1 Tax=Salix viminalis TaxID=40686 RepID=A0A6N2K7S3_SALVM